MSDPRGISWRTTAGVTGMLLLGVASFFATSYLHAEERHEDGQDARLSAHDAGLRAAELERTTLQAQVDRVAAGVQWLVDRRAEELGSGTASPPPSVLGER